MKWQKKALEHPEVFRVLDLEQVKVRLKLYEAGKPYHEPKPEPAPNAKDQPKPKKFSPTHSRNRDRCRRQYVSPNPYGNSGFFELSSPALQGTWSMERGQERGVSRRV